MLFVDALAAAKREFSPNSAMTEVISGPDIVVFVSLKVGPTGQLDRVDSGVGPPGISVNLSSSDGRRHRPSKLLSTSPFLSTSTLLPSLQRSGR